MGMRGLTDHMTLEATGATAVPFGVGETRLLIRTILELGITAISCTPSYPAVLERVIAEDFPDLRPVDLKLQLALFGGEAGMDDLEFRRRLESVWGFKVETRITGSPTCFATLPGSANRTTTCISSRWMCSIRNWLFLRRAPRYPGGRARLASWC